MARRRRPFLRLPFGRQTGLPERNKPPGLSTRKLTGQNLAKPQFGNRKSVPVLAVLLLGLAWGGNFSMG